MTTTVSKKKFNLDPFQEESIKHIKEGSSVITCAPTGAGKTIIAKEAIRLALTKNKRVFYTAPLKALINQKYYEFCEDFGEENVGIVTGDTNKNRDSKIVVMTTEIYRNMLYGTTFGSIDPFLQDLQYLIFDEFHFINDSSRGTAWEESVIYTPKSVQIIALSATINNPQELVNWIQDIHGECRLVETHDRPIPLFHYFFKEEQLTPLLTPNGKLNPKLKERSDNRFGKRGGKFGNRFHQKSEKSGIAQVVSELNKKEILPAIYFVFSRKGCDKAAEECRDLELLNDTERKKLEESIAKAIAHTPVLKNYNKLELLKKGIAAHHAGLLPQIKSIIEELFAQGLIKVVFSTETLAAGINMPAKTTVINSISKATDEGFRTLTSSEFMQMSGRAGRRGMDDNGYVVTVKNGNYTAGEVALLAGSKPEDVTSHFAASYEMVLNLLLGHEYEEIKGLIQKSFGQYLVKNKLVLDQNELKKLEEQIEELQHPLCPGEIGDLNHYHRIQQQLDETRKQKKQMEKNLDTNIDEVESTLEILTMEAKNYPCNGCPKQKPCSKQMDKITRYRKQAKKLESDITSIRNMTWENFSRVLDLLRDAGYVDKDFNPQDKGKTCAAIRSENSYFITELVYSDVFQNVTPSEFATLVSCFVVGEVRAREKTYASILPIVSDKEKEFRNISRRVIQLQRNYGIDKPVDINPNFSNLLYQWASGKEWDQLMSDSLLDDGDVLRSIRRTLDICKQISKAPNVDKKIQATASEAIRLIERDIVVETI